MEKSQYFVVISNISVETFLLSILQEENLQHNMFNIEKMVFISYQEYREQRYQHIITDAQMVIVWLNLIMDLEKNIRNFSALSFHYFIGE